MRLPRGRGRGAGRGRGIPRMPLLGPRHRMMGTPELPPPFGIPRGPMRMRPGPLGFPRGRMGMGHPELPPLHHLPPHHGFHPGDRLPPLPRRPPGMQLPPAYHHMAPGPPGRPPLMGRGRGRGVQGRGGRGRGVKRLTTAASGGAKKKKNKLRTAVLSDFYCDACDRGYKSAELLAAHVATHETCGRDGCKFTAQPKVVLKHVQMQHDTGLYLRIRTENPEDVAKWITERKSRFPTKENIERRLAQRREMIQRGERISAPGRQFFNRNQRDNWRENYTNRNREISVTTIPSLNSRTDAPSIPSLDSRIDAPTIPSVNSRRDAPTLPSLNLSRDAPAMPSLNSKRVGVKQKIMSSEINNKDKWRDFHSWRGDLPMFPGTAAFIKVEEDKNGCKEELQISDEEEIVETKVETPHFVKPVVSGVLAALVADYGSDMTEDEDDDDESSSISKDVAEVVGKIPKVETINTELDNHIHVDKEVQMQVSYEQQKSVRIMGNSMVSDGIKQEAIENNINYKDPSELPFDNIEPVKNHMCDKNETIPNYNTIENSTDANIIQDDSDSGPEEQRIDHKDTIETPVPKPAEDVTKPVGSQTGDRNDHSKMSRPLPVRHRLPRHQLSLLEKLLGNEIRQERNMILQCVRYVVKNNFFN